ncbi:hypothetical protein QYM36_003017 [Artemia franciscana]|uniref:Cornichon protein n=1 Tax=Artemia franciscana TaxID=6661 RepID=A0AA88I7E8_ARTSF|nr:hypothetical protein QYM36_003017 [Artemia franciscana]
MTFGLVSFSYLVALALDVILILFSINHVSAIDELNTEFRNPVELCKTLNPLVLPEYMTHIFMNILFLFAGEWTSLAFNIPLIAYHAYRYSKRTQMSSFSFYDPTNIMNADVLNFFIREGWIKMIFYLLSFFYYLYGLIYSTISTN